MPHFEKQAIGSISLIVLIAFLFFWWQFSKNQNLFNQPIAEHPSESLTFIPIYERDPIIGNRQADITIIAFEDFLCEGCRSQNVLLNQLLEEHGDDVKIIWKDLSILTIPQSSELAHTFGYCMNEQKKFEEYKNSLFATYITIEQQTLEDIAEAHDTNMRKLTNCLSTGDAYTHLDKNKTLARALNIQSVPTFFVQDKQIVNPVTYREWVSLLELE